MTDQAIFDAYYFGYNDYLQGKERTRFDFPIELEKPVPPEIKRAYDLGYDHAQLGLTRVYWNDKGILDYANNV